jgi:hypothetical protein
VDARLSDMSVTPETADFIALKGLMKL